MLTPVDRKIVEERLRSLRDEGLVTGLAIQRDGGQALIAISAQTDSGAQDYNEVEVALVKKRLGEALQDIPFDVLGLAPPSERAAQPGEQIPSELSKSPPVGAESRRAELVMLAAERVRSQHAQDTGVRLPLPPVGSGPAGEPTPLRDGGIPADRESLDLSFRPGNGAHRGSNSQDPDPGTSRPVVDELPQPEHTGSAVLRLTAIAELALHETRSLASRLSELEQETKALPTRRFVYGEGMIILVILAGLIAFQPELKAAIAALAGWIGSFVSGLVR